MLNTKETSNFRAMNPVVAIPKTQAKTFVWPWRYDSAKYGSRDVRMDLLRGLCLAIMLVDHIGVFGPDSWLYMFTARGDFFISAAEGFVFISGLVMGLVYFKIIQKEGIKAAISKATKRAVQIYWLAVGLTLFFVALATYTNLDLWAQRDWIEIKDPLELIVGSLTLHFAFHGSSILVMYVVFLFLAPLVFYFLSQGKVWQVLAASWAVWLGNLFYPEQFSLPFAANFPIPAWQALFVSGLVIGYYRKELSELINSQIGKWYQWAVSLAAIGLVWLFLEGPTTVFNELFPSADFSWLSKDLHEKGSLPLVRMLAIFICFQVFFLLANWLWKPIDIALGWLLVPLGEAGLYVFSMHLVVIVLFYNIPGVRELPYFFYGFALVSAVLLLWVMVKTKFLFNIIPR